MENEALLIQQFEEIEQKVERLIATCKSLETANINLKNVINSQEADLHDKSITVQSLSEERATIRSKIDTLLVKLENIVEKDSNSSQ